MISRLLTLILISFSFVLHGQESTRRFSRDVETKAKEYYMRTGRQKAAILFNQPEYFPGDTAWFSAFIFPRSNSASTSRSVLDVVVVTANGSVLVHNRTLIQDDRGKSQLIIPAGIPAGVHQLIAFKESNGGSYVIHEAPFTIAGKKEIKPATGDSLSVFIESNILLADVENKILVTGVNTGDSVFVTNQSGQRVAATAAGTRGYGVISFSPVGNESYSLVHNRQTRHLTNPQTDGVILSIDEDPEYQRRRLRIRSSAPIKDKLYLVVRSREKVFLVEEIQLDAGREHIRALGREGIHLPRGIYIASILNSSGGVLCERVFYQDNDADETINISPGDSAFGTRSQVTVDLSPVNMAAGTRRAAAITAYNEDFFSAPGYNIFNQMLQLADAFCSSNLQGDFTIMELNDVLISAEAQVSWADILRAETSEIRNTYPSYFVGRVYQDGAPVRDSTAVTFWLKDRDLAYDVYTREGGRFDFPLFLPFGDDELLYVVSFKDNVIEGAIITVDSLRIPRHRIMPFAQSTRENRYYAYSSARSLINSSYTYFTKSDRIDDGRESEPIPVDFTIDVTRFKPYETMIQLINEVIPLVKAKKTGSQYGLRVFLKEIARYANRDPLVMIDGVVTDSVDYMLSISPTLVKIIGVVNSRSKLLPYGALGKNGILVVETTARTQRRLSARQSVVVKGIDNPIPFASPDFSGNRGIKVPNLKPALFWNPDVSLQKSSKISFYTADDTGTYRIHVAEFTEDGFLVEGVKQINVTFQ